MTGDFIRALRDSSVRRISEFYPGEDASIANQVCVAAEPLVVTSERLEQTSCTPSRSSNTPQLGTFRSGGLSEHAGDRLPAAVSRIFYRNCVNLGLAIVACPAARRRGALGAAAGLVEWTSSRIAE